MSILIGHKSSGLVSQHVCKLAGKKTMLKTEIELLEVSFRVSLNLSKRMKVLIVHHATLPVEKYGGIERVIWCLGKELVNLGHKVVYLVNERSYCDFAQVLYLDLSKDVTEQIPDDIDIIHFNSTPTNLDRINKPFIVTIHGNSNGQVLPKNTIFVSQNHAIRHGSHSYIHNGLDWSEYSTPDFTSLKVYFHFLGKAAWRLKNVKGAINVIKGTKQERLKVLGGFRFNIKMGIRFTFSSRIDFHGMVGGVAKDNLLKNSKGLIFPVRWHEPFGLAITESLYFGCPVFGTPYGSLPEIVIEDVGYLSANQNELIEAIKNVSKYSRKRCHDYAQEYFNSKFMAMRYIEKYEKIVSGQFLNEKQPRQINSEPKFLPWN